MPLPSSKNVLGHQDFLEMMKDKLAEYNHLCISSRYCLFAMRLFVGLQKKYLLQLRQYIDIKNALVLTLERQYYWFDQVGTINIAK